MKCTVSTTSRRDLIFVIPEGVYILEVCGIPVLMHVSSNERYRAIVA